MIVIEYSGVAQLALFRDSSREEQKRPVESSHQMRFNSIILSFSPFIRLATLILEPSKSRINDSVYQQSIKIIHSNVSHEYRTCLQLLSLCFSICIYNNQLIFYHDHRNFFTRYTCQKKKHSQWIRNRILVLRAIFFITLIFLYLFIFTIYSIFFSFIRIFARELA